MIIRFCSRTSSKKSIKFELDKSFSQHGGKMMNFYAMNYNSIRTITSHRDSIVYTSITIFDQQILGTALVTHKEMQIDWWWSSSNFKIWQELKVIECCDFEKRFFDNFLFNKYFSVLHIFSKSNYECLKNNKFKLYNPQSTEAFPQKAFHLILYQKFKN